MEAENKKLAIDTGLVTYSLNGKCELTFNPTDSAFVEVLFNAFDTLDSKQEKYKAEIKKKANNREVFEVARKMDEEMREIINEIFGVDVCGALFGGMNVYALAGGLPVWANLMLTIMDEVDTSFAREKKAQSPRIAKYTKKYGNSK